MAELKKLMVRLSEEQKVKLELIAKEKYRGTSLSQAVRWMIEDMSKELKEKEVVNV